MVLPIPIIWTFSSTLVLCRRIISCTWQLFHCLFASLENLPSALLGISFLATRCCVAPVVDVVISRSLTKSAANCVQIVLVNWMEGTAHSFALTSINHVMSLCYSPPLPKKVNVFIQQRPCSSSFLPLVGSWCALIAPSGVPATITSMHQAWADLTCLIVLFLQPLRVAQCSSLFSATSFERSPGYLSADMWSGKWLFPASWGRHYAWDLRPI